MDRIPPRDGYGKALLRLVETDERIVVLDADVAKSTRTEWIKTAKPKRFIDMGISEQDMVGTAAGLALSGMIPFATTYSVFLAGRAWDQIRTTVLYSGCNVKLAGAHAGINVGPDGATHQAMVPCDAIETEKATMAIAALNGPAFIRFGREAMPVVTSEDTEFELGKARLVSEGDDVVIFANGPMVYEAMEAGQELLKGGIHAMIVDVHTIKPLDCECIVNAARKTGAVVTAEDHQDIGGLGSAVCECLSGEYPVPVIRVGLHNTFGESGQAGELMEKYGISKSHIISAVKRALELKR